MMQTACPRWSLAVACTLVAALCGWAATVLPWREWTVFAIATAALGASHGVTALLAWCGSHARARAWRVQSLVALVYLVKIAAPPPAIRAQLAGTCKKIPYDFTMKIAGGKTEVK